MKQGEIIRIQFQIKAVNYPEFIERLIAAEAYFPNRMCVSEHHDEKTPRFWLVTLFERFDSVELLKAKIAELSQISWFYMIGIEAWVSVNEQNEGRSSMMTEVLYTGDGWKV